MLAGTVCTEAKATRSLKPRGSAGRTSRSPPISPPRSHGAPPSPHGFRGSVLPLLLPQPARPAASPLLPADPAAGSPLPAPNQSRCPCPTPALGWAAQRAVTAAVTARARPRGSAPARLRPGRREGAEEDNAPRARRPPRGPAPSPAAAPVPARPGGSNAGGGSAGAEREDDVTGASISGPLVSAEPRGPRRLSRLRPPPRAA